MKMQLSIQHITVEASGITVETRISPAGARVGAAQAQQALRRLSNLARHVCVNEHGDTFGDEIEGTEPAHLFEHVAIELMAQTCGSGEGLMGHTSYTDERGLMLTKLTYKDDLQALACIKRACAFVNELGA